MKLLLAVGGFIIISLTGLYIYASRKDRTMVDVTYEITKEEFEKAQKEGADVLVGDDVKMGYGLYGARVKESEGKYYLSYSRGESCD